MVDYHVIHYVRRVGDVWALCRIQHPHRTTTDEAKVTSKRCLRLFESVSGENERVTNRLRQSI